MPTIDHESYREVRTVSMMSLLLSGVLLLHAPPHQDPAPAGGLQDWIKQLEQHRDDADPELIKKIANAGTRPAMQALVKVYDSLDTIYMKREVVRALAKFDGIADAEQPALEKITNVATDSEVPELREAAVEALGQCQNLGKHFLAAIVSSDAFDDIRERAIQLHVERAAETDVPWYRKLWDFDNVLKQKATKKELSKPPELETVRETAFSGLRKYLTDTELEDALKTEQNPKIRRLALEELHRRGSAATREMAERMFDRVDIPGSIRAEAAKMLAEQHGPRMAAAFIKLAKKKAVTQEDLRQTMARLIVEMNDPSVNKKVASMVGRGKPHEKIFALQASANVTDPGFVKRIRRGLRDRDFDVRRATAMTLAKRGDKDSVDDLKKWIERPRDPRDVRVAIEALSVLLPYDTGWTKQLVALTDHENRDARNAALSELAKRGGSTYLQLFVDKLKHEDWSTRLVAIKALEALRKKAAVPALIDRLGVEQGRLADRIADALWNLTGQPFEHDVKQWKAWWKSEGAKFHVIGADALAEAAAKRELKRLRQRTVVKAKFFGIKIISHRVIFVIDTSGSMVELVQGRFVGKRGATRIEVAKQELLQCIDNLEPQALFNIISFSSGFQPWVKDSIGGMTEHTRAEAREWVGRLGAGGATDLYDALKAAFDDPDVDTIFVLSDGEPTAGAVTDPYQIREDVKFWNRFRDIKINTIAVGGSLEVLEWLAKDSGGSYVRFR